MKTEARIVLGRHGDRGLRLRAVNIGTIIYGVLLLLLLFIDQTTRIAAPLFIGRGLE